MTQDKTKAFEWYLKSANHGCAVAMGNVQNCYENGIGVKQDSAEAAKWKKKAESAKNA